MSKSIKQLVGNNSKINLISAFFWSTTGRITGGALKFFATPLLLAYFGKDNYGLIGLALSINVYMQIMELGFNTGNIRFISQWLAEKNEVKVIKLIQSSMLFYGVIGLLNVVVLLFLSFFCQTIFNLTYEETNIFRNMLYILSVSSFISWTWSITSQVLRAYEKIAYDERLNLIASILIFTAVIITIFFDLTLTQYFFLYGLSIISIYPIRVWKCKSLNPQIKFKLAWNSEIFKEVLSYSIGIFAMSFFQFSARNLRPIIIGIQGGVSDVADYNILLQITNLVIVFSGSFMGILLPFVTKMNALKNTSAQKRVIYDGTKYLSVLIVLLVFGLIVIAKPLLILYVGVEYEHLSFWLILWSIAMLSYHNGALAAVVLSQTNIKPLAYYSMFSAAISLLAAWFLVPVYFIGGAVISLIIYSTSQMLFYYVYYIPYVMNLNSLKLLFHSFLKPVIMGIIGLIITKMIVLIFPLDKVIFQLIIPGIIFTFIYIVLVMFFVIKIKEFKKILH